MSTRTKKPQAPLPGLRSPVEVVKLALETFPEGRWRLASVAELVEHTLTMPEFVALGRQQIKALCRGVMRSRDAAGLPVGAHVGAEDVRPAQLEFAEWIEFIYNMARRGKEMFERARTLAEVCEERTGRALDADVIIQAATEGEAIEALVARLTG